MKADAAPMWRKRKKKKSAAAVPVAARNGRRRRREVGELGWKPSWGKRRSEGRKRR